MRRVEQARVEHPVWFDFTRDAAIDAGDRAELEQALAAQLPDDFVWFLAEYGGGDFAFASVYSGDPESDLYIVTQQSDDIAGEAIAFSDDGTGNAFVFPVRDGICSDEVAIWDHETREYRLTGQRFLDFLAREALQPAA